MDPILLSLTRQNRMEMSAVSISVQRSLQHLPRSCRQWVFFLKSDSQTESEGKPSRFIDPQSLSRVWPTLLASQVALVVKNPPANAGDRRDLGSIPRSGRCPGGEHGNSLQRSCLENPMDRGAWQATRLKRLSSARGGDRLSLQVRRVRSWCFCCPLSGNSILHSAADSVTSAVQKASQALNERGERLGRAEEKTEDLKNSAQQFAETAHKVGLSAQRGAQLWVVRELRGPELFHQYVCHAAAKSLQPSPTLCSPRDSSPPGSSVHGTLQARVLEWVAVSFSKVCHDEVQNRAFFIFFFSPCVQFPPATS